MSFSKSYNQKNLLCKKMNINCCDDTCQRSHSIDELHISNCNNGIKCKNIKCPFIHPYDKPITKEEYYKKMYEYIDPYNSDKTSVCRYYEIGCKIEKCRKAHSVNEIKISKCDCFRLECPFYHENRDQNISKQEYFDRMKLHVKIIKKSNKHMICRYIDIGCQRNDCPYAHNIKELQIHKCIFSNCKLNCIYLHNNEDITKQEYFNRMVKYIQPFESNNILCHKNICNDIKCKYAHNYKEFIVTDCIRGIKCKKHCCPFKHSFENFDKNVYFNRMLVSVYPN
jgi:hypothetical protein